MNLHKRVRGLVGRVVRKGRSLLASASRAVTRTSASQDADDAYRKRIDAEKAIFDDQIDVHALPEIFNYWSNTYLRPKLESFGFSHPDAFFAHFLERACADAKGRRARFVSIGAGNCDTEVRVARMLVDRGMHDFTLECLELNPKMIERGIVLARENGVASQVLPMTGDFNFWKPTETYDAVMANQSLHHVSNLEGLFDAIRRSLAPNGRFITSDMIGRNGHQRWPEAATIVREFWRELPESYRYNVQLRRQEHEFLDWDCSQEGFEGVHAQDILPQLIKRFDFEFFIGFANVIDPFIDRSFGHHFDAESAADRAFIDRIHARDEEEILAGRIKPTHMLAVMRKDFRDETLHWKHLTPAFCVRDPNRIADAVRQ
jgi:SAM-dependent methyltransferase